MFGENLKELRKSKSLSMEDLASQYNVRFFGKLNKSTLSRYENNLQEPMINVVKNLAEFFSVPIGVLTGETHPYDANGDIFSIPGIMPIGQWKSVPLLGTIACGEPILADENIEMYLKVPDGVTADFALRCKGDSMINARIFDGDVVYIRQEANINNGDIVAVLVGDEATLKKLYRYSNRIELRAENPTFPVLEYEGEELDEIRILGKAVAFMSILR